ncbi:MAG TPA: outer membrane protein assembly factor BamD [Thermoanaerobaculia bacterium]|nr:outer membrane protein assembly factor BamD [Thermoanaerobaculia bacterium]
MNRSAGAVKRVGAALLAVVLFAGCSGNKKPDRITRDLLSLPKETIFEKGKALLARKKLDDARKYLNFVFESYPNDPLGQKALLMVADSYFQQRGRTGFLEARYRYRDFVTRYPSAPDRDFALYRYALCYDREHETPDRDPTNTREAIKQYENLLRESPGSPYADESRKRVAGLKDVLAEHEFAVGLFYLHKGDPSAALGRFHWAQEHYADYSARDKLLFFTAEALEKLGRRDEADKLYADLTADFPGSPWALRVRKERRPAVDKPAEKS